MLVDDFIGSVGGNLILENLLLTQVSSGYVVRCINLSEWLSDFSYIIVLFSARYVYN